MILDGWTQQRNLATPGERFSHTVLRIAPPTHATQKQSSRRYSMVDDPNPKQRREAAQIMGEMAASRLHSLFEDRLTEVAGRISQVDIARRLGISEQQVSRWLGQPRNITVKSAGRLMAALDAHLLFEMERFEEMGRGNIGILPPASAAAPKNAAIQNTFDKFRASELLAAKTQNSEPPLRVAEWRVLNDA